MGLDGINNRKAEITEKRDSLQNKAIDISARRAELNAKIAEEMKKSDGTNEVPKDLAKSWMEKEPIDDSVTVKNGQSFKDIAEEYGVSEKEIKELNEEKIHNYTDVDNKKHTFFRVGEKIVLPDGADKNAVEANKKVDPKAEVEKYEKLVEAAIKAGGIEGLVKAFGKNAIAVPGEKALEILAQESEKMLEAEETKQNINAVIKEQAKELQKQINEQVKDLAPKFIDDNPSE